MRHSSLGLHVPSSRLTRRRCHHQALAARHARCLVVQLVEHGSALALPVDEVQDGAAAEQQSDDAHNNGGSHPGGHIDCPRRRCRRLRLGGGQHGEGAPHIDPLGGVTPAIGARTGAAVGAAQGAGRAGCRVELAVGAEVASGCRARAQGRAGARRRAVRGTVGTHHARGSGTREPGSGGWDAGVRVASSSGRQVARQPAAAADRGVAQRGGLGLCSRDSR